MRAQKNELSKVIDNDDFSMFEAVWGEMHVEYDFFKKRFDITPYLKGLPNDRDPCPHWGVVLSGQARIITPEGREEIANAGDVYYAPPGHTGVFEAGTELWEFSPNDKLQKTMEVISRNFELMQKKEQAVTV